MVVILPLLHQRFMQLFAHDDSDQSAFIQKQILKIFHAYTQVRLETVRSHVFKHPTANKIKREG